MANTFLTTDLVVRDAAIILQDNCVAANLCNRSIEQQFVKKVGKTIEVKTIPDIGAANEFSSTTSATDITETSQDIIIQKHFYQKVAITTDQLTWELDAFNDVITRPCILSLKESIDSYLIDRMAAGFARYLVGTAGTEPSTIAHLLAGRKSILDNRGSYRNVAGIIGTTAETALLQLAQFTNADYGTERPNGLREGVLGRMHGATFFTDQNCGDSSQGDVAGTVLTDGDPGTTNTIHIDALTAATGTIYAGTRFTVADDSSANVYTVMEDATIASNECDLIVEPAADASVATDKAVTFATAHTQDMLYNVNAVHAAILPPAPFMNTSSIMNVDGMGVRVSLMTDHSTLAQYIIFDTFAGCKVIHNHSGSVFQG